MGKTIQQKVKTDPQTIRILTVTSMKNIMIDSITNTSQILIFTLDDLAFALPLTIVKKVIHAIEIRHLPNSPDIISGIINLRGKIIPVADIRKRLGLNPHEISPDDNLIIAETGRREVAVLVDTVTGISDLSPYQITDTSEILPFTDHIKGVAKTDNGIVLIYDLNGFLSIDEERELELSIKTLKL